ncbi:GTP-binding protein [Mycoplasmopsis meleagridis]|uniref:GTPase Obg n=1 Tax=Mycoplasmopsis meleagridis ATCC 25294 TaxID=1264554 RepID=A0A0F5H1N1_9BACT|nr:GTPase ObgE [Mycoplasmopsis meleagridis]KKB27035.1 GTP-binding protein Obg [Mycoplasmopsis meleagridis ATCC 25294]KUH47271.1 GTPase Obg [Mycoplasmopsis meleagridis]OAD18383.1 GTP-binding protein [Mycoplasmopsis meleagridis]VEU77516.1 GTPase obg [Mycoplasmopsis meleagridis]
MARFIDQLKITLQAGKGGNGMISFRREAHVDKGGPDGGDGGRGGNIYFVGDAGKNTLLSLYGNKKITAQDGVNGGAKNLYGAAGKDTYIKVPLGTIVYKDDKVIADVVEAKEYLIARGGIGGRGNLKFKSPKNTAPRICENGSKGEHFEAKIVLKVMADVGIVGKPSAGKSTLLSALSNAKAKIADYEFTTLIPQLGLVKYHDHSFTLADLPGLIKGASLGKGLGIQFLKHIERCRVIVHVIDFGSLEKNPLEDYETINNELKNYSFNLEKKAQLIIANKNDLEPFQANYAKFINKYPNLKIVAISALENKNFDKVKKAIWNLLEANKKMPILEEKEEEIEIKLAEEYKILNPYLGFFEIIGPQVQYIYEKYPINTYDNLLRFNQKLKNLGIWDELLKLNIQKGDTVRIFDYEFEWDGSF